MNGNTRTRLKWLRKALKDGDKKRSGYKRKKQPFLSQDTRPDLAGTFGYDGQGRYIGKPWNRCF